MKREIIVICGPTAVGKTEYAIDTALRMNGEIVSCDSMQLYKYMDIGSAKPTVEEQARVRHYLVDQIDPAEAFSAAKYQTLAKAAIEEIFCQREDPCHRRGHWSLPQCTSLRHGFQRAAEKRRLQRSVV